MKCVVTCCSRPVSLTASPERQVATCDPFDCGINSAYVDDARRGSKTCLYMDAQLNLVVVVVVLVVCVVLLCFALLCFALLCFALLCFALHYFVCLFVCFFVCLFVFSSLGNVL